MPKTLMICIDGTWNSPGQTDQDPITREETTTSTNVVKVWEAVTKQTLSVERPYGTIGDLAYQHGEALYLSGVGSGGNKEEQDFDGATGAGTASRILDAYRFIAERWEQGDGIFAFGFSRGAFAVRSALGFLNHVGLPATRSIVRADEMRDLFSRYRDNKPAPGWTHKNATVTFLGVWETVGALAFGETLENYHQLNPENILCVRHALALDEIRKTFLPEYWTQKTNCDYQEVWFAGAHSNVGGGYVDDNLSNLALFWMLEQAQAKGLKLELQHVAGRAEENPSGEIRDSYEEFWGKSAIGKLIEAFRLEQQARTVQPGQILHESVLEAAKRGYKPAATFAYGSPQI